jgi:predicted CXXCH cytochrome family protein
MKIIFIIFVTLAVLSSETALAGIEGTHHDMTYFTGRTEKGVCSFCHIPHGSLSEEGLFSRAGVATEELGKIGGFCYSCHDGTVVPTAIIEAPDGTIGLEALMRSHGSNIRNITDLTGGMETPQSVVASGLLGPDVTNINFPDRFDCVACHDVHSNKALDKG